MKVVITGISGHLGTAVAQALSRNGVSIIGVDRVAHHDCPCPIRIHDLTRREAAYHALQDGTALVHLANHAHPYGKDAQNMVADNTAINMNVFQAAAELGFSSMVFASSIQVIASDAVIQDGPGLCTHPYLPIDTGIPPKPGNPYALSKLIAENLLAYFHREHKISTAALRFPWLARREQVERMKQGRHYNYARIDDVFAYLQVTDAADLIARLVQTPPPGHHVYMPAANDPLCDLAMPDLIERYYADIPLLRPVEALDGPVEDAALAHDTGWQPTTWE